MAKLSESTKQSLSERWENRVTFDELERKIYAHDMGVMPAMVKPLVGNPVPDGIVQPASESELVDLVNFARLEKINLVPRGKATSGYGGILPVEGGLVVEFNRMKKIIDINAEDRTVTVEPGVVWNELEYHLNAKGLTLALYPTSAPASTVGGWLAMGGAGFGSYEFGNFQDNVDSARMVRADGQVVELSDDDLDMVSDCNGITGLISQITFRVKKQKIMTIRTIAFDSARELGKFIKGVYDRRVPIWSMSFINPEAASLKNRLPYHLHHGTPVVDKNRIKLPEKFIILLACTIDRCDVVADDIMTLAAKYHGEMLSNEIAEHEWDTRFEPVRAKRMAPSLIPGEVVIGVDRIADVIEEIGRNIDHPFILEGFGTNKRELVLLGFILHDERTFNFNLAYGLALTILKSAQKFGGRPYATGLYFTGFADKVLGRERLERLIAYKKETDINQILNPGKVIGNSLISAGISVAGAFEPLIRVFGNWAKGRPPGEELFKEKKGIPGDIAWYAYTCSQCGYCVDHCDQYYGRGWESQSPRGKWTYLKMVIEGEEEFDQRAVTTFLSCTTCEMCNRTCQLDLPNESSWLKLRGNLVDERGFHTFPPFEIMVNTLRNEGNIWGGYSRNRADWVTDEVRTSIVPHADYALFAGCTASYVENDVALSTALLLKKAGIDFAFLGNAEKCCGIPMLVAGRWEVFDEIAADNIKAMAATGAKTIVTTCPACWLVWEVYYRKWANDHKVDFPFQAKHYADVMAEEIANGRLTLTHDVHRKVTYHDPCHMGRAGHRYEGPRALIKAIPGADFREMRFNKDDAHCCGSVLSLVADPDIAAEIGAVRIQEAIDCGADTLITACPCCRVQLKLSRDAKSLPIQIRDLSTLAAEALGYQIPESDAVMDEKWAVFDGMIRMMTPWGMADMMAEMIPEMIEAMPDMYKGMMKTIVASPEMVKEPMLTMMSGMMPKLFPVLLPGMMPKIMPKMLELVGKAITMPAYLEEQMPNLMPKTMAVLMPKMLPEIIPYFMPKMLDYLRQA